VDKLGLAIVLFACGQVVSATMRDVDRVERFSLSVLVCDDVCVRYVHYRSTVYSNRSLYAMYVAFSQADRLTQSTHRAFCTCSSTVVFVSLCLHLPRRKLYLLQFASSFTEDGVGGIKEPLSARL